ncbi:MAG: ThiF family adenylyltransferase [Candidatus Micrarchaeota archaeon]
MEEKEMDGRFSLQANDGKECFSRQAGLVAEREQTRLARSCILVAGLGGVGGIAAELAVRAGVGKLVLIDFDRFEKSNFNRQLHATRKTEGKMKAGAFAAHARSINPKIRTIAIAKKLDARTYRFFEERIRKEKPDIAICSFDDAASRVLLGRLCRQSGIAYVYAAAADSRGMVGVFAGKERAGKRGGTADDLEKILRLPSLGKPMEKIESALVHYPQCRNAWGPAANLAGVLAANAALNYLLKKPYARAPNFWMIDAFEERIVREEKLA